MSGNDMSDIGLNDRGLGYPIMRLGVVQSDATPWKVGSKQDKAKKHYRTIKTIAE